MRLSILLTAMGAAFAGNVVMEQSHSVPAVWTLGARAHKSKTMTVHAMLKHNAEDVAKLEEILMQVSDPRSDSYGKHLSLEEVGKVTPIPSSRLAAVKKFFAGAISSKLTPNKDILTAVLQVEDVERMFSTKIHSFTHENGNKILRAVGGYSLPADVAESVYVVADVINLPAFPLVLKSDAVPAAPKADSWPNECAPLRCENFVTPNVLKSRYSINSDGKAVAGNSMAVAEFQGQYFKPADIKLFGDSCGVDVAVDTIIGGDENKAGIESELDIEYIRGVSPNVPLTVIYADDFSLVNWMININSRNDAELVHSLSYGNDEKQQISTEYMFSTNVQFMKAGARGLSILCASGDQGVCGREGCGFRNNKRFKPDFPGGSPYITAVGGTDFVTQSTIGEEKAWVAGGGGFSDTFAIPDWQKEAVQAYKANPLANLPEQSVWNNTGRGYPDVSALGGQVNPYCVVSKGKAEGVAGTSASCPVFAGVVARLNEIRLSNSKASMGFLNPFIYQNLDAFNDVTEGCNSGGSNNKLCFQAVKGWDAATGAGTPNLKKLAERVNAL